MNESKDLKRIQDFVDRLKSTNSTNDKIDIIKEYNDDYMIKQVLKYTKELMSRSFNDAHRLIRMRARPKILLAKNYEDAKKYAQLHKNIIKRFGRFPYRNKVLGRKSTKEEKKYLNSTYHDFFNI